MAEIQLPWFYSLEHLPVGAGVPVALGEGALSSYSGSILGTSASYRVLVNASDFAERTHPPLTQIATGMRVVWYNANAGSVLYFRTAAGATVLHVYKTGSGLLEVRQGSTVLGASGQSINTMRYVECSVGLVGPGLDTCTLKVDGVTALALTGLSLGTTPIEAVRWGQWIHCTHWYIRDAAGLENPFYGPILPRWLPAATDVGTPQWTRNGGTSNAGRLRDYPAGTDQGTTYVETQTLGHRDEYTVDDLPPDVNSIIAVVPFAVATAPSGGAPQHRLGVKTSAGELAGPERTVGVSSFQTQCGHALTQKPGGGGWSRAAVNEINLTLEAA